MTYTVKKGRISHRGQEVRIAFRTDRVFDETGKNIGNISYNWEELDGGHAPETDPKYVGYSLYYFDDSDNSVECGHGTLIPLGSQEERVSELDLVAKIVMRGL